MKLEVYIYNKMELESIKTAPSRIILAVRRQQVAKFTNQNDRA